MTTIAKGMSDDEMKAAAEYFATDPWNTPWIKVVESATVPKTRSAGGMWMSLENNETEPIGSRIVEMPVNNELVELRDYRSEGSFMAYVPPGSIKKGEALATSGDEVHQVQRVPRRRFTWKRTRARHRGPLAQLHRSADVRHAAAASAKDPGWC